VAGLTFTAAGGCRWITADGSYTLDGRADRVHDRWGGSGTRVTDGSRGATGGRSSGWFGDSDADGDVINRDATFRSRSRRALATTVTCGISMQCGTDYVDGGTTGNSIALRMFRFEEVNLKRRITHVIHQLVQPPIRTLRRRAECNHRRRGRFGRDRTDRISTFLEVRAFSSFNPRLPYPVGVNPVAWLAHVNGTQKKKPPQTFDNGRGDITAST